MHKISSADGTPIAFDAQGSGPLLIVVGGAFNHRKNAYSRQLTERLVESFTVITYDRRGRGDSGDTQPYSVARETEDLTALVAATGEPTRIFGMSSGAILAFEAAASGLAPAQLALWEPPYFLGGRPLPATELADLYRTMIADGRPGDVLEFFMTRALGLPSEVVQAARRDPSWQEQEALAPSFVYDTLMLGDGILPLERASKITTPTRVMEGGATFSFLRGTAHALAAAMPNGSAVVLPQQQHGVGVDALAPELLSFFTGE